jgi:hypothetical protein
VLSGADDLGGHPQSSGDDPAVDNHQAQVVTDYPLFDQHLGKVLSCPGQRGG